MIKDFNGKVVLITGAGSGIGRSTSIAFAKRGARIVATDVQEPSLAALRSEIERLGASCTTFAVDVSDESAMKQLADDVHAAVGPLDVLVNNAGVGYLGPFLDGGLAQWPRILGVNVMGVVHGCYYFLPRMVAAGGARHVLNVASSAANVPPPSVSAYAASKSAVYGFSEVLKMELRKTQVRVTTVCPGVINTTIVHPSPRDVSSAVTAQQRERLVQYYQKNGASPDAVAEDMVKAVQRGTDILLTGPSARLFFYLRRISPRLARWLIDVTAKSVGYRG